MHEIPTMLTSGAGVFLNIPDESGQRVLHCGTVAETGPRTITVQLEDRDLELTPGREAQLYFESKSEFMQQAVRIDGVLRSEPKLTIGLKAVGEPVSAENRQCFRVSTATSTELEATLAEAPCSIVNVSATGFSAVASTEHAVGSVIDVEIRYLDRTFTGLVSVQSMRPVGPQRIRYGLHCLDDRRSGGELGKGLQYVTMAVQQQKLRRRAGRKLA